MPKRGSSLCRKRLREQAEDCARDSRCLGRQALARDQFHLGAEAIQFRQSRIHIRRNPDALELFMNDRRRKDVVFVEKILHHLFRFGSFNVHVRDGAGLFWIKGSIEVNLWHLLEPVHPVARQVTQARFFALCAEALVKEERLPYG